MDLIRQRAHHASWRAWKLETMNRDLHKKAADAQYAASCAYDGLKHDLHHWAYEAHMKFLENGFPFPISTTTIKNAVQIKGFMWEPELRWLAYRASQSKRICEIGSALGRSTRAMADNIVPNGNIYAIDIWRDPSSYYGGHEGDGELRFQAFQKNIGEHLGKTVVILKENSTTAVETLRQHLNGQLLDFLFVDGDHGPKMCSSDIRLYRPLLRSQGCLAGHDFYQPSVFKTVTELVGEVQTWGRIWFTFVK
jgi:hypothetical protein